MQCVAVRAVRTVAAGQDVHIYERYQDSAAALTHVQRFVENFAPRFLSLCTPTCMSRYGEPREGL